MAGCDAGSDGANNDEERNACFVMVGVMVPFLFFLVTC